MALPPCVSDLIEGRRRSETLKNWTDTQRTTCCGVNCSGRGGTRQSGPLCANCGLICAGRTSTCSQVMQSRLKNNNDKENQSLDPNAELRATQMALHKHNKAIFPMQLASCSFLHPYIFPPVIRRLYDHSLRFKAITPNGAEDILLLYHSSDCDVLVTRNRYGLFRVYCCVVVG